ncbi:universal stress protein [Nonlabens sp. MB-3u-79]|jgi:nucleotide-binding universal stress UspA family protein|uniref:universal stress protein n=1 Tax=Nonlabens sp. MB-3u-79 TaxID=2058134 RepID=UPI000C318B91|nr:universal stress protein [Nonlabens sp. MB-3u-79]AUC80277.1 universal stress protein [Nonlabens sp. MB-3u-79]
MNNILLLTDFTLKSENAHEYALKLFKGQKCNFHLLSIQKFWEYTMDDLMIANPKDNISSALLGDNMASLKEAKEQLIKQTKKEDFNFHTIVDYDVFTTAINDAVENYNIDLIVCGTNGKSDIMESIFSSHTLRIIHNTECPLLAVPEGFVFVNPRNIEYLLDYDDLFDECGKDPFLQLVKKCKSIIHVMRLNYGFVIESIDYKKEQEDIIKYFHGTPVVYEIHIDEEPIAVIEESMQRLAIQMQVLSAHKESFIDRIFSNSHLSKIVNMARLPILILRTCHQ